MSSAEAAVFGAVDYSVFVIMLSVSLAIGIYFGFFGKKSNSVHQYLSGVQNINLTSIGISLVASAISGSVLLTFPSEIYSYGIMLFLLVPCQLPFILLMAYVYIPVYYNTGVSSSFEYLERRFDWKVSRMISFLFVVYTYAYTPIIQYMPCLAFSQVSGLNVHMINTVSGLICVIYTIIGGIKAVIWTDVVQGIIMYVFAFAVIVYGVINVGGVDVVFNRSEEEGRLNFFDFDIDLTKRNTFWMMLSTGLVTSGAISFTQTFVQRLIALKSRRDARRVVFIYYIGFVIMMTLTCFTGLVIFATYYKCDPIKARIISKGDRIMPYFVMNTIGHWIGMPGLFISAMFSAGFSSISAQLNSLSGIVYNDYFRKWRLFEHTDFRASLFMKLVVLITGIYFIFAGFMVDNFGHIVQISTIITAVISIWLLIGNQMAFKSGRLSYPPLPTSVEDCEFVTDNYTSITNATFSTVLPARTSNDAFILYRLSFYSYSMVTVGLVWVFGLVISFITGYTKPGELDKNVIATCVHWMLPKDLSSKLPRIRNDDNRRVINSTSRVQEELEQQIPLNN